MSRARAIPWLLSLAMTLASAFAVADGGARDPQRAVPAGDKPVKYGEACNEGNARVASHDLPGAIALYRVAIDLDPRNPLGDYLLGEAQLASGNIAEAEAAWNRASLESGDKDPAMRARILFVIADLKERQWMWVDAKAAWQVYLDWVTRFPSARAFPASARSRQQVIDAMIQQDKAYEVVRRRIAETKDGGVFTDLSKAAPGYK